MASAFQVANKHFGSRIGFITLSSNKISKVLWITFLNNQQLKNCGSVGYVICVSETDLLQQSIMFTALNVKRLELK